jgi:hypothetical protein
MLVMIKTLKNRGGYLRLFIMKKEMDVLLLRA